MNQLVSKKKKKSGCTVEKAEGQSKPGKTKGAGRGLKVTANCCEVKGELRCLPWKTHTCLVRWSNTTPQHFWVCEVSTITLRWAGLLDTLAFLWKGTMQDIFSCNWNFCRRQTNQTNKLQPARPIFFFFKVQIASIRLKHKRRKSLQSFNQHCRSVSGLVRTAQSQLLATLLPFLTFSFAVGGYSPSSEELWRSVINTERFLQFSHSESNLKCCFIKPWELLRFDSLSLPFKSS